MEEKKSKKSLILLIFLIIAIIAICVMGFFIYSISSEKSSTEEQLDTANQQILDLQNQVNTLQEQINPTTETLQNGNYVINGMTVTPDEGSYGIESITISENNNFSINLPLGTSYVGTYTLDNNTITCNATQEMNLEGGGSASTESTEAFQFEIVDSSNLRFLSTTNESLNLTVGMLYTLEGSTTEVAQPTNSVDISGVWAFQSGLLNNQEVSASDIFGSDDETIVGTLTLNSDGTFSDLIGKTSITDTTQTSGTYTFDGNAINLVYANAETQTLTYNSADNTIQYPASNYIYVLAKNQ